MSPGFTQKSCKYLGLIEMTNQLEDEDDNDNLPLVELSSN